MNVHAILSDIDGCITSVEALVYEKHKIAYVNNPQKIYIEFSNGANFTAKCASDGESIEIFPGLKDFHAKNMGDLGNEFVKNITDEPPWVNIARLAITSKLQLIDGMKTIGIGFLSSERAVYLLNLGDELFSFDTYPQKQLEEDDIRIVEVH